MKTPARYLSIVIMALAFGACDKSTSYHIRVTGTAVDEETDAAIAGANVRIEAQTYARPLEPGQYRLVKTISETRTDSRGQFAISFSSPYSGHYIVVEKAGYHAASRFVSGEGTHDFQARLEPLSH